MNRVGKRYRLKIPYQNEVLVPKGTELLWNDSTGDYRATNTNYKSLKFPAEIVENSIMIFENL